MPQNVHLEMINAEVEHRFGSSGEVAFNEDALRSNAAELARGLAWLPSESSSRVFVERCRAVSRALKPVLRINAPAGLATSDVMIAGISVQPSTCTLAMSRMRRTAAMA